jgi:hypothetical protein
MSRDGRTSRSKLCLICAFLCPHKNVVLAASY